MTKPRLASVTIFAMLSLVSLSSAQATHTVTVTLALSSQAYPIKTKVCPVSVSHGTDGIAVLEAAKMAGCISSYSTASYPGFGTFVSCIDQVCGDGPGTQYLRYWAMRENCVYTSYGVDAFRSDPGDELSFTFEAWPVSSVPMDAFCIV